MNQTTHVQISLTRDFCPNYRPDIESRHETNVKLDTNWKPGNWDVICQRGKEYFEHVGNRRFRMCIQNHLENYIRVESKQEKSLIVAGIVESILDCSAKSGGYGFVKKDLLTRRWVKVSQALAREKVGQALRDLIKARRAELKKKSSEMTLPKSYCQAACFTETSCVQSISLGVDDSQERVGLTQSDTMATAPLSSDTQLIGQKSTCTDIEPARHEQSSLLGCKKDRIYDVDDKQDTKRRRVSTGVSSAAACGSSFLQVPSCDLSNIDCFPWPANENLVAANSSFLDFGYDVFWPSPAEFEATKSKKKSFASRSA